MILFLLMECDCSSELTLPSYAAFWFSKWQRWYVTCQVFTDVCSKMRVRKRVSGESRLMLIRELCVFPAQSGTLIMTYAGCSQNLSPPTTSEARQDSFVGGCFLGRCSLICQGQDLSKVEEIHLAGSCMCGVIGEPLLVLPHKIFLKSIILSSSWFSDENKSYFQVGAYQSRC